MSVRTPSKRSSYTGIPGGSPGDGRDVAFSTLNNTLYTYTIHPGPLSKDVRDHMNGLVNHFTSEYGEFTPAENTLIQKKLNHSGGRRTRHRNRRSKRRSKNRK